MDETCPANGCRLMIFRTFLTYIERYQEGLEPIREDQTFLVRQLAPSTTGVPLEVYCFSGERCWKHFEGTMGDIFDHLLAVVGEFDLRVYQQPSFDDLRRLVSAKE